MFYLNDYLTASADYPARIEENAGEIVLTNGIAERRFLLSPDFACVSLKNLFSGEQFLRSVTAFSPLSSWADCCCCDSGWSGIPPPEPRVSAR